MEDEDTTPKTAGGIAKELLGGIWVAVLIFGVFLYFMSL